MANPPVAESLIKNMLSKQNKEFLTRQIRNHTTWIESRCNGCGKTMWQSWGHIYNGAKCRKCSRLKSRVPISKIKSKLQKQNRLFLDIKYRYIRKSNRNRTDVKTKCYTCNKTVWQELSTLLTSKVGCRYCVSNCPLTHKQVVKLLVKYEYTVLSPYKNAKSKMTVRCPDGHILSYECFSRGQRCSACHFSLGEEITRKSMEFFLRKQFPKCRPDFLKISSRRRLELDGFSKKLRIAFEYQGQQHFKKVPIFSRYNYKKIDSLKKELCIKNNVQLIIIKYSDLFRRGKFREDSPSIIRKILSRNGISLMRNVNITIAELSGIGISRLKELQNIAIERGGYCLSKTYLGSQFKLKWVCKYNHHWWTTPNSIKSGTWCPHISCRKSKLR